MGSEAGSESAPDKRAARRRHKALADAVTRAVNDADPIGLLSMGAPDDEYSPEIGTIVPRLATAADASDIARIMREEFVRWFNEGAAGPEDVYAAPARRIWEAILELRGTK